MLEISIQNDLDVQSFKLENVLNYSIHFLQEDNTKFPVLSMHPRESQLFTISPSPCISAGANTKFKLRE